MFWRSRGFPHAPLCPTFPDGSPACQQCIWVDYWGRFPSGVPLRMKSLSLQAKAVSLSCPVLDEDQRCWTVWESPKESLLMLLPSILAVSKIVNSHLLPFIYLFIVWKQVNAFSKLSSQEWDVHLLSQNPNGEQKSFHFAEVTACSNSSSLWESQRVKMSRNVFYVLIYMINTGQRLTNYPRMVTFLRLSKWAK